MKRTIDIVFLGELYELGDLVKTKKEDVELVTSFNNLCKTALAFHLTRHCKAIPTGRRFKKREEDLLQAVSNLRKTLALRKISFLIGIEMLSKANLSERIHAFIVSPR